MCSCTCTHTRACTHTHTHSGGAETGDVSKILTQFNKEEEEEKQRRASESYVAFGPTTNECDSKGRPEGRRRGGKQQGSGGLSQLWGGRDLVSVVRTWCFRLRLNLYFVEWFELRSELCTTWLGMIISCQYY